MALTTATSATIGRFVRIAQGCTRASKLNGQLAKCSKPAAPFVIAVSGKATKLVHGGADEHHLRAFAISVCRPRAASMSV